MFRVRNGMDGSLVVDLEKGSITLQIGKSFDLETDGGCSRKWINNNKLLWNRINNGALILVYDSQKDITKPPIDHPRVRKMVTAVPSVEKPQVIHLTDEKEEKPKPKKVVKKLESKKEEPKVTKVVEGKPKPPKVTIKEPSEDLPDLEKMKKSELVTWAFTHGLDVDEFTMTKRMIKEEIEKSEVYQELVKEWEDYPL